ncbi:hypothetical protein F5Y04DRAFT_286649 [Hypomontagnella monticulosa]|nr:hypothetical protein F5Y04DRAFT_286649 [Hypomontagnella monticulosa]
MEANAEQGEKGATLSTSPTPKVLAIEAATEMDETEIGVEDAMRINIYQHNSLGLQDDQVPPSSRSSGHSSPPTSHSLPRPLLTVSTSLSDVKGADLVPPSAPPTPRTRRFLDKFRAMLSLLPAHRYPVSPSSPALSTYSIAAVSVSDYADYEEEDRDMNMDAHMEGTDSVDNRDSDVGATSEVTEHKRNSKKRKELHTSTDID